MSAVVIPDVHLVSEVTAYLQILCKWGRASKIVRVLGGFTAEHVRSLILVSMAFWRVPLFSISIGVISGFVPIPFGVSSVVIMCFLIMTIEVSMLVIVSVVVFRVIFFYTVFFCYNSIHILSKEGSTIKGQV